MTKLKSLFKFEGTLDDVTAYRSDGNLIVRRKGGISASRIASDPDLIRIRENNAEFATIASAGNLIKSAFSGLESAFEVKRLRPRLVRSLAYVKNMDTVSPRGKRNLVNGFATDDAKARLVGFNFNILTPLNLAMTKEFSLDAVTKEITINQLITITDVKSGIGANVVGISAAWSAIDFEGNSYKTVLSNEEKLPIQASPVDVSLTFPNPPEGSGLGVIVLAVRFYQEVNGVQYALTNKSHNAAAVIEVTSL